MFERANKSLPARYVPDARFIVESPGGKPHRVIHRVSPFHVDELFMHLCIPQASPLVGPADYPLVIPRYGISAQLLGHSRLLSELFTVYKSNPVITTAQKMLSVLRVERSCVYKA